MSSTEFTPVMLPSHLAPVDERDDQENCTGIADRPPLKGKGANGVNVSNGTNTSSKGSGMAKIGSQVLKQQSLGPYSPQVSSTFGEISGLASRVPDLWLSATISRAQEARLIPTPKSHLATPFIIGVCGGTASGKTTVCNLLQKHLTNERIAFLPSDVFYKSLTPEQRESALAGQYDFDHPNAVDWEELTDCLNAMRKFQRTSLPTYDYATHSRTEERQVVKPADVIIVEGILIFAADAQLRNAFDLKIFVDCDADIRLARRVSRDIEERGREVSGVLRQYLTFVKPSFDTFVEPSKRFADIIIPNLGNQINMVGVELLVQQIRHQIECRRSPQQGLVGNSKKQVISRNASCPMDEM